MASESGLPTIAYLAEGKLYLQSPGEKPRLVESTFAQGILDRVNRSRQKNDWKEQSFGWNLNNRRFNPMGLATAAAETRRIRFTGLTKGQSNQLLYALDTDYVGGLFCFDAEENYERRLFHRNQFRAADLCAHPKDGLLALSLMNDDGTANIATMESGGKGVREVTEGDSVDEAPAWAPVEGKVLVFQSAGIGRNPAGMRVALGPYAIEKLDLDSGDFTTLLEGDRTDFLSPRIGTDGSLYFIRRPYEPQGPKISPLKLALDMVLFPFRLVRAIVHFLNFFSLMFSHKPLLTAGGPPKDQGTDQRFLMLWGRVIDAQSALKKGEKSGSKSLVPKSWELVKSSKAGEEKVLANSALSYDLLADGGVVYTDGSVIYHLPADGEAVKIGEGKLIERVAGMENQTSNGAVA